MAETSSSDLQTRAALLSARLVLVLAVLLCGIPEQSIAQGIRETPTQAAASPPTTRQRQPVCQVDSFGLPQRVIVTRNGTGLFEKPAIGAKRLRDLALYERLYVYSFDSGSGFQRVGADPWGESALGWVPSRFCLAWDHNEVVFLSEKSVPTGVDRMYVWGTEEAAEAGDPEKAIYTKAIEKGLSINKDQFFPVLQRNKKGTLYKIGFPFGGDQQYRDDYGQRRPPAELQRTMAKLPVVNLVLLVDTTGAMGPYVDRLTAHPSKLADALEGSPALQGADGTRFPVNVNVGFVAYRDKDDHFDVKVVLPLTADRESMKSAIASLRRVASPQAIPALNQAMEASGFARGALNRIIWVTNTPPCEIDDGNLSALGMKAKSRFVQVDVFACGGDEMTEATYRTISASSGGTFLRVAAPDDLMPAILKHLEDRVVTIPLEKKAAEAAAHQDEPRGTEEFIRDLVGIKASLSKEEVVMRENEARRIWSRLIERGAELRAPAFRQGWVQVSPEKKGNLRVYLWMPRWQFMKVMAEVLELSDRLARRKDPAKDSEAMLACFLALLAGEHAASGLDNSGRTLLDRAGGLPQLSTGISAGAGKVVEFERRNRMKILELMAFCARRKRLATNTISLCLSTCFRKPFRWLRKDVAWTKHREIGRDAVMTRIGTICSTGVLLCLLSPAVAQRLGGDKRSGIGGVLLTEGKIPRKVLAKRDGLQLYDNNRLPAGPFKTCVPYFVFEEKDGLLLVDRTQNRDVAKAWVKKDECHEWISRRLAYPKPDGGILRALAASGSKLSDMEPKAMMPWPVLSHKSDESEMVILCDLRSVGGKFMPVTVRRMDEYDIYVVFTATELVRSLSDLVGIQAVLESGKRDVPAIARTFGKLLAQDDMDFLDLDEVKRTLDLFPGGTPSYLLEHGLEDRFKRISDSLGPQIDWLNGVHRANDIWNEEHDVYVVPLKALHKEAKKT